MNMAQRPVEKHYGRRTLQERPDGYLQINIPKQAADDPKIGVQAGGRVTVKGVILNGESYLKIEGVSDE